MAVEGLRKKDSWTWTTKWGLQGGGGIEGLNDNGKKVSGNNKKIKLKIPETNS